MTDFSSSPLESSGKQPSIGDIWRAFEAWLGTNWPAGLDDLNPPATEDEIGALEAALGVTLPRDFVECLRIHNGQAGHAGGLFDNSEFLSTAAILEQWTVWKELLDGGEFDDIESAPEPGIRTDWWNAGWIPFTHNGGGDHYCLDCSPESEGATGQVITMWHDMAERTLEARRFELWFRKYVYAVLAGKYVYSEDFGGLTNVDFA